MTGGEIEQFFADVECGEASRPRRLAGKLTESSRASGFTCALVWVRQGGDTSPPQVKAVGMTNVNGVTLGYAAGTGEGNASVTQNGNSYKITGTAPSFEVANPMQSAIKPFEIDVTCLPGDDAAGNSPASMAVAEHPWPVAVLRSSTRMCGVMFSAWGAGAVTIRLAGVSFLCGEAFWESRN